MNRRSILLSGGTFFAMVLSGCLDRDSGPATRSSSPEYDCDNANRPTSPSTEEEPPGESERYIYPQRPESLSDNETVTAYVEEYERAYRLSGLYTEYGNNLDHASISVYDTWNHEASEGASIARLSYSYRHGATQDGDQIEADSPTIYAAYYIDDTVVLRSTESGHQEDESELVPDPTNGRPVECF